jgi:predicted Holliday junction resolvase-like endonuclease
LGDHAKAFWILILVFCLIGFCLWLRRGVLRAKNETLQKSNELNLLRASQEEFRATAQRQAADSLEKQLSVFRTTELAEARNLARQQSKLEYDQKLAGIIESQRADAIKKSRAVNRGLVAEQLAPHMAGFAYNPKDCHFLGSPVDYVVFSGLDAGKLDRIVLLEVKTGESTMNARERQVRDAVQEARVSYEIFKLEGE